MSTPPLLIVSSPLPPSEDLLPTCRKLILFDGDWLFLINPSLNELLCFQLNNHSNPLSHTATLLSETLPSITSLTPVFPALGFIQRSSQTIPVTAHTTVVTYTTSPGKRNRVIEECSDLFRFAEESEMDVYSLAIMTIVEDEDGFVILERYKDQEAEQTHLQSERCVKCLERIREFIVGHDSKNYTIVDV